MVADSGFCIAMADSGSRPSRELPSGPMLLRGSNSIEVSLPDEEAVLPLVALDDDFLSAFFTSETLKFVNKITGFIR